MMTRFDTPREWQWLLLTPSASDEFGSTEQLDILQSVDDFLVDGIFKLNLHHTGILDHLCFMLDFEQACINVLDASFPHIALSGCYFHLRQSIHRQIQSLGYQTQYQNDPIFAHNIPKIAAALAFIHPDVVINAFERLSSNLGDEMIPSTIEMIPFIYKKNNILLIKLTCLARHNEDR
ncbi:unnamed protein product [Didymodactylos carnosus]|uniref:MULE transposase domain-containing protein n=1 Tax=Didymodactylos carnosus TaxID=1234261 RepID=A0A8S2N5J3_9BILA|nr:unnamed protein product [Didymodactylos carnosus]CAF3986266.1 unnamed protein product [Didymodactylos carnosus]